MRTTTDDRVPPGEVCDRAHCIEVAVVRVYRHIKSIGYEGYYVCRAHRIDAIEALVAERRDAFRPAPHESV